MFETYAFLAVFTLQILAMSVLYPARLSRYVRAQAASMPIERLAPLYPNVDLDLARERILSRYRKVNTGIAVLGVLLLGWLFSYMRSLQWHEGAVVVAISLYFSLQMLPIAVFTWLGFKFNKTHKRMLVERQRRATLERRGLFDFISPLTIVVALASYFLFTASVTYVQPKPLPGFALIGVLTLVYVSQAFVIYRALYGKKTNALETHARRVHTIGLTVKVSVYSSIVAVVFFAIIFTFDVLDLKRWVPLAQSVCLLITTFLCLMSLAAPPPRHPEADELDSSLVS
jgi:MFS family permease